MIKLDPREALNIIRDLVTYISIQSKNDHLGSQLLTRALRVIDENEIKLNGDTDDERTNRNQKK